MDVNVKNQNEPLITIGQQKFLHPLGALEMSDIISEGLKLVTVQGQYMGVEKFLY